MVLRGAPTVPPRLRREDHLRTKHDTAFSRWRVLVGPSDWEDYLAGKEGAERYRVGNLPTDSCPGVYEIGVAVCATWSGRDVAKVDKERIVVVYLGQADSVRCRLQHYGRSGSHLVNGVGLFKEVFLRGYPIVYRWAPMKSKSDAERTEAQLLETFDYAWNKVGNGSRRPNDILEKMEKITCKRQYIPKIVKLLQALSEQRVGIPIKEEKLSVENKSIHEPDDENLNFFNRVFNFSRSKPRLVSDNPVAVTKAICGVISSDGSICSKPPVAGRKRCAEHRGRRLNCQIISPKSIAKDSCIIMSQVENFPVTNGSESIVNEDSFSSICGISQHDGSPCVKPPLSGRRRCMQHKGMKVNKTMSKSPELNSDVKRFLSSPGLADHCGVHLGDGKCCERQPVSGRKRCEEHKGMRIDSFVSKLSLRSKWINAELTTST